MKGTDRLGPAPSDVHGVLIDAIQHKGVLRLRLLSGEIVIAEPHIYGSSGGYNVLLIFILDARSIQGWRVLRTSDVESIDVLQRHFERRPIPPEYDAPQDPADRPLTVSRPTAHNGRTRAPMPVGILTNDALAPCLTHSVPVHISPEGATTRDKRLRVRTSGTRVPVRRESLPLLRFFIRVIRPDVGFTNSSSEA